jgi:hypothetical protein
MMKFTLISTCLFCVTTAMSQPLIEWQRSYGGSGFESFGTISERNTIKPTPDGGYIFTSGSNSADGDVANNNNGDSDFWVAKVDGTGGITWENSYGGSSDDVSFSIALTSDGGYVLAGYSSSTDLDVTENHGSIDILVIKINATGEMQWQKLFGGSISETAHSIIATSDGGYIIAGDTSSIDGNITASNGGTDCWILKLDSNGDLEWQKNYGGSSEDLAYEIIEDSDGYVFIGMTDSTDGDVTGIHGTFDYWIVKIDFVGNLIWQKAYGGEWLDSARSIRKTNDGGYIICGETTSNDGNVSGIHGVFVPGWPYPSDGWIIKTDANGNLQWQSAVGGEGADSINSIEKNGDGYIAAGYSLSNDSFVVGNHGSNDVWVIELSDNGEIIWQKPLGGSEWDHANSVAVVPDGFIVAGTTWSNNYNVTNNHGYFDLWLVKLNYEGMPEYCGNYEGQSCALTPNSELSAYNIRWFTLVGTGGTLLDFASGCSPNGYSDYTGILTANIPDDAPLSFTVESQTGTDGGFMVRAKLYADWNNDIDFDDDGEMLFENTDPALGQVSGSFLLPPGLPAGNYRLRVMLTAGAQIESPCSVMFGEIEDYNLSVGELNVNQFAESQIKVYPNPTNNILVIHLPADIIAKKINITDLSGKVVYESVVNEAMINVENLAQGLYILQVQSSDSIFHTKFLKQ